jgi:hypothetical protein
MLLHLGRRVAQQIAHFSPLRTNYPTTNSATSIFISRPCLMAQLNSLLQ